MLFVNRVVLWCDLYKLFQEIDFFLGRGPAGDETADGVVLVGLTEMRELHLLTQAVCLFVADDDKLLIGGRVDQEFKAFANKDVLHPHGSLDGIA